MNPNIYPPVPNLSDQERLEARGALDVDDVDQLFQDRKASATTAADSVLNSWDPATKTPAQIQIEVKSAKDQARDQLLTDYLDQRGLDSSHAAHTEVRDLIDRYDYGDDLAEYADWMLGTNGQPTGKERFEAEARGMFGNTINIDSAEILRMEGNLESTRTAAAEISAQRRRLLLEGKGKKAKRLAQEYEVARAAYNAAKMELGEVSVQCLEAMGMPEAQIRVQVLSGVVAEHNCFTRAEAEFMENDDSRLGRVIRFCAARKLQAVAVNGAVGFAMGFALKKVTKNTLLAIFPPAALAAVVGSRVGKALLTAKWGNGVELHRDFEKRRHADSEALQTEAVRDIRAVTGGASEYAELFTNSTSNVVDDRIKKDVRNNKIRTGAHASVAGGFALAGAYVADHMHMPSNMPWQKDSGLGGAAREHFQDRTLQEAGVTDSGLRERIINNPDDFERWVTQTPDHTPGTGGVHLDIDPSGVATDGHEVVSGANVYTIHEGGGIIKDVIRPAAYMEGHGLTHTQETQIWQAMRDKFGNDLFNNLSVVDRGGDQWISNPGQGQLKPEVAKFLKDQIAWVSAAPQAA